LDDEGGERVKAMLDVWCEQVDNYLVAIQREREKHRLTGQLADALKDPVLDRGMQEAIDLLRRQIGFDDFVLAYHHEDARLGDDSGFKVLLDGAVVADSAAPVDSPWQTRTANEVDRFLRLDDRTILKELGLNDVREQVLINGVTDQRVIGRLVVHRRARGLNTFDMDLLQRFADFLRQRIVDFNREYKQLAVSFPPAVVRRLMGEEGYAKRYLQPVERDVVILYTDIVGFTRLSEQVLRSPAKIGHLIDVWSERVVEILWQTGGVFDKMIGDCVIGLWGPPFYDLSPPDACRRALAAAREILDFTRALASHPDFPELAEHGLGVSTGINFCPASVGFFGPHEDYTAFGSGMNNAARLQGLAGPDEILVMESAARHLDPHEVGEERKARVKNVENPLRFFVAER
ncbi:MAG: adenylate/guanylate cyclase domain-containing protein, partial [Myxococcota bacterium]